MENLINFDESGQPTANKIESTSNLPAKTRSLINDRSLSFELNNPFDKCEYRATHSEDPFECLELKKSLTEIGDSGNKRSSTTSLCEISNISSIELSSLKNSDSTMNNAFFEITNSSAELSENTFNKGFIDIANSESCKRCQSDSNNCYGKEAETKKRFHSVDSKKSNSLLKLSLLNSPLNDSVFNETKKVTEKIINNNNNETSYEDLDNISQNLVDVSNNSTVDPDLEQLKISFLESNPVITCSKDPANNAISKIQETLEKIKKEDCCSEDNMSCESIKQGSVSPLSHRPKLESTDEEFDHVLDKIKSLMKSNNKEEAKKQLLKLNRLIGASSNEPNTLQVQPVVRQDTFDIDPQTGQRKYTSAQHKGSGNDEELIEQVLQILNSQSFDSANLLGNGCEAKVVFLVNNITTPTLTPVKQCSTTRRSSSFSHSQKPQSAIKAADLSKRLATPMKHQIGSKNTLKSSLTAPRSTLKGGVIPAEKKIGAVRKSLMGTIDKSPTKLNNTLNFNGRPATIRRSVSLKASVPSLKVTEATPLKLRPVTSSPAPYRSTTNCVKNTSTPITYRKPAAPTVSTRTKAEVPLKNSHLVSQKPVKPVLNKKNSSSK